MTLVARLIRFAIAIAGNTVFYAGTGYRDYQSATPIHRVFLDDYRSFSPQAVWPYLSLFPFILWSFLRSSDDRVRKLTWQIPIASMFGACVFVLAPTYLGEGQPCGIGNIGADLCQFILDTDTRKNCLPSLHAAMAVLCLGALWRDQVMSNVLHLVWAIAICCGAICLRQHLTLDILAGAALGLGVLYGPNLRAAPAQQATLKRPKALFDR